MNYKINQYEKKIISKRTLPICNKFAFILLGKRLSTLKKSSRHVSMVTFGTSP